ncbi:SagB family peptide dehydrogenase [Amorphoplanes nipponensis]|uniref:Nitroreductase domain-containing protein n=1 Tax=Actinoplanes nipponensis TaxID=135950 RepID=A0A919J9F9_9ACTN|nr:SagB family peptide dehydrogenase [Actinoplanes nipponensis]GIE46844.1 hypothetical protein Ani05nite_03780 [Actinoplanes nipponensis]
MISVRLRLRPGVFAVTDAQDAVSLLAWPHLTSLGRLDPAGRALLDELAAEPGVDAPPAGRAPLVDRLRAQGWLTVSVRAGEKLCYELEPRRPARPPGDDTVARLSRFAVITRSDPGLVLRSPLAWCDVRLHDPRLLAAVADPSVPGPVPGFVDDLRWAGLLATAGEADDELRHRQWATPDLWFHAASRLGARTGEPTGATGWAQDRFPPLPARPPARTGTATVLDRPDLDALRRSDPSLTTVVEQRQSVRRHDDREPLTVRQVGEFLYRCARVRGVRRADGLELVDRPFPSAGALHELELYLIARHVAGLAPGVHHYDAHGHRLEHLSGITAPAHRLVSDAGAAAGMTTPPQLVVVTAARFGRVLWKYQDIGYALILKNAGVLCQTMYLAATAMGLAPCAIGSGDSAAFAAATGLDPLVEGPVAEFVLGSRPAGDQEPR